MFQSWVDMLRWRTRISWKKAPAPPIPLLPYPSPHLVHKFGPGPEPDQELSAVLVAVVGRVVQRRVAVLSGQVDVGAVLEQQVNALAVPDLSEG